MTDGDGLPAERSWPPGRPLPDAEAVAANCNDCGAAWRVHVSLAGFRLRCGCGAFVAVPAVAATGTAAASLPPPDRLPLRRVDSRPRDDRGQVLLPADPGEMLFSEVPTDLPLAPGALRQASPTNQARWTNRTLLEFTALFFALVGPQVAALWLSHGREFELLLPFASLASGALVAIVVAWAGPCGRIGFQAAAPRHYGESLLAAAVGLGLAVAWLQLLEATVDGIEPDMVQQLTQRLGVPMALFVVAVSPAVLEEVVFRGVLQGRLLALLGRRAGLLTTAAAFALCHAQPAVLPIHMGLGLWLGWLRERCGSLLPGMLMHFAYNGSIVVLGIG